MMVALVVAFVGACLLAWFGCVHRARAVADLAAVAGATAFGAGGDACGVAAGTADQNGAEMVACDVQTNGFDFIVRVSVQVEARPHIFGAPEYVSHTSQAGNI